MEAEVANHIEEDEEQARWTNTRVMDAEGNWRRPTLEELPPLQQAGEQQNEEEAVDGAMEGGISRRRKLKKLWTNVRESAVRGQEEVMGTDSEESTLALPLNFASFSPRRLGITWSVYPQGDQVLLRTVVSRQGPAGHQASRCKQG